MKLIGILLFTICLNLLAEEPMLNKIFLEMGITGTLIVSSLDGKTEYIHDDTRVNKRLLPASTFKIPNTLIALEENIIKNDSQIITWDGIKRDIQDWNRDQTLMSAFKYSCVWFYQKIAEQIGIKKYDQYIKMFNYGNQKIGTNVTRFWLEGEFSISAKEQIGFLRTLLNGNLKIKKENLQILKKIMIVNQTEDYIIRAKTGWASSVTPQHGWYVGYVEKKNSVWLFAANIDIKSDQDLPLRKEIVMEALKVKGII